MKFISMLPLCGEIYCWSCKLGSRGIHATTSKFGAKTFSVPGHVHNPLSGPLTRVDGQRDALALSDQRIWVPSILDHILIGTVIWELLRKFTQIHIWTSYL
jgi:hypothetical protein